MMGTRDGYYSAKHMSFRELVKLAYQLNLDDQLVGASGWMDREYFDIEAKAGDSEIESMRRLGAAWAMEQFRLILQSFLEDRFRLKVSTRVQDLPAYALVVARGGPKLKEVAVPPAFPPRRHHHHHRRPHPQRTAPRLPWCSRPLRGLEGRDPIK